MTFVVTNQSQFDRAWAKAKPGDQLMITVHSRDDYFFPSPPNATSGEIKASVPKTEWSGVCC